MTFDLHQGDLEAAHEQRRLEHNRIRRRAEGRPRRQVDPRDHPASGRHHLPRHRRGGQPPGTRFNGISTGFSTVFLLLRSSKFLDV